MEPLVITAQQARELIEGKDGIRLVDCRERDEYAICKIDHAELIPFSNFFHEYQAKLPHKHQVIVIYCHHGMRSLKAAEYLSQFGYARVHSIQGGIEAWSREIDPGVPEY